MQIAIRYNILNSSGETMHWMRTEIDISSEPESLPPSAQRVVSPMLSNPKKDGGKKLNHLHLTMNKVDICIEQYVICRGNCMSKTDNANRL